MPSKKDIKINTTNISRLGNMKRFQLQYRLHDESVAEHSFYVASIARNICLHYGITSHYVLSLVLETALMHDVPELITSDVPYNVKKEIPELKSVLDKYEKKVLVKNSLTAYKVLYESDSKIEYALAKAIVKLADDISANMFCEIECSLGNKTFDKLLDDTESRVQKSALKVEKLMTAYIEKVSREEREYYASK